MLALTLMILGCTGGPVAEGDSTASGNATHQDAETDANGAEQEPAQPDPQTFFMEITVEGSGDFTLSDPECSLDGGAFDALYEGEAEVDGDGVYVASLTQISATSPSGCEIPSLSVSAVTDVIVRAELEATTENCSRHCEAEGRFEAEQECAGDADEVTCRGEVEAQAAAECEETCTTQSTVIVAESSLGVEGVADVSTSMIEGSGLGAIEVDLVFDRTE